MRSAGLTRTGESGAGRREQWFDGVALVVMCGVLAGCVEVGVGLVLFLAIAIVVVKVLLRSKDTQEGPTYAPPPAQSYHSQPSLIAYEEPGPGFQITVTSSWEMPAHAVAGEFLISEQPVALLGHTIPRPMFYVGVAPANTYPDASLIDPSLAVASHIKGPIPEMGYWPSYAEMAPGQRQCYLRWLAGGRCDPEISIGYVFVFYYGLERRLLLDGQNVAEIMGEVNRLRTIYAGNNSFTGYSGRLLTFLGARALEHLREQDLPWYFPVMQDTYCDEATRNAVLAWYVKHRRPLPWQWALKVAHQDPRTPSSVVLTRVKDEFEKLFGVRYQETFGEGLALKAGKSSTTVSYHPSSGTLSALAHTTDEGQRLFHVTLPNVLAKTAQFKPLVKLFARCVDDLRGFSRSLAKVEDDEPLTSEAWEKLPPELREHHDHPEQAVWLEVLDRNLTAGSVAYVPASELAIIKGIEQRKKLTASQGSKIADTASKLGYAVEPDPRLTRTGWDWEGRVAVFHDEGPDEHLQPGSPYNAAAVMLQLSLSIAAADGDASEEEIGTITEFMESQLMLTPSAKRRLETLGNVLLRSKISLAGIGKRIQSHLDEDHRRKLGQLLVAVAAADGVFYKQEIAALKRAFKAIGLSPEEAVRMVEELAAESGAHVDEPVPVRKGRRERPGEPIPPPPEEARSAAAVQLDRRAIARILEETRDVSLMLGKVLTEEEEGADWESDGPLPEPMPSRPAAPAGELSSVKPDGSAPAGGPDDTLAELTVDGLDPRYREFLSGLLRRQQWSDVEMRKLAEQNGVMVGGAIEAVNEWSDETLGDFLLEGEGPYTVNQDLLPEKE